MDTRTGFQSTCVALVEFRGELVRRTEVEVSVGKFKRDEIAEEMIKGGGGIVVDWI